MNLTEQFQGTVKHAVNRFANKNGTTGSRDEMLSDAWYYAILAVRDYDAAKGTKLSTYITYRVQKGLLDIKKKMIKHAERVIYSPLVKAVDKQRNYVGSVFDRLGNDPIDRLAKKTIKFALTLDTTKTAKQKVRRFLLKRANLNDARQVYQRIREVI